MSVKEKLIPFILAYKCSDNHEESTQPTYLVVHVENVIGHNIKYVIHYKASRSLASITYIIIGVNIVLVLLPTEANVWKGL